MNLPKLYWIRFIFITLLATHIFFQFYNLREWITFGFDQVDNAWAATRILIERTYPMVGMMAKNSSGIYIGPLYYYLVALFYLLTNFDPIASPLLAGCTSILSFFVLYIFVKKLFNTYVALWSLFIYTFSLGIILADRVQWPVNFIPLISLSIFYTLYKILQGHPRYILWLSLLVGLSFHIHFTSIFYPLIILATLPFFPKKKETLLYILVGLGIVSLFLIPNILYAIQKHQSVAITNYAQSSTHGFHGRRFLQIAHDAFIQFELIIPWHFFRPLAFVLPLLFSVTLYFKEKKETWKIISFLTFLWFIVPWIVFTLYKGEISNYYFDITRFITIFIIAYITHSLWGSKYIMVRLFLVAIWMAYAISTCKEYFKGQPNSLPPSMIDFIEHADQKGDVVNYEDGKPIPYLHYIYRWKQSTNSKN